MSKLYYGQAVYAGEETELKTLGKCVKDALELSRRLDEPVMIVYNNRCYNLIQIIWGQDEEYILDECCRMVRELEVEILHREQEAAKVQTSSEPELEEYEEFLTEEDIHAWVDAIGGVDQAERTDYHGYKLDLVRSFLLCCVDIKEAEMRIGGNVLSKPITDLLEEIGFSSQYLDTIEWFVTRRVTPFRKLV